MAQWNPSSRRIIILIHGSAPVIHPYRQIEYALALHHVRDNMALKTKLGQNHFIT